MENQNEERLMKSYVAYLRTGNLARFETSFREFRKACEHDNIDYLVIQVVKIIDQASLLVISKITKDREENAFGILFENIDLEYLHVDDYEGINLHLSFGNYQNFRVFAALSLGIASFRAYGFHGFSWRHPRNRLVMIKTFTLSTATYGLNIIA
ncbi:hypothetical protein SARC_07538 [Sphaeroforma arctica JP610]|uniref:Uncharacterized protein n=1 Tax=Sphaeroforma arctica JP610 TaxID=667725 RepID=A0A0L0FTG5_9EUKA|nr:hypothetical protein SARC_07538 [Sphaeroforma arctica JP610]KNC80095.1 hypothetical protein SARC_07538 [Sphaeroforma arctica JP610]|eukprot:XP_014153997.1 hypothetical protein SARC_07538 [Sphaeroforma arctica JP610]